MESTRQSLEATRRGVTATEFAIGLLVIIVLLALLAPVVQHARERSRQTVCRDNLRTLASALHAYHDVHESLPPAAVWDVNATRSLALHESHNIHVITHENWAQLLLPYVGHEELSAKFNSKRPIGDPENAAARTSRLSLMTCPLDPYNSNENRYVLTSGGGRRVEFARGNYGINGGTHNWDSRVPTTEAPRGDTPQLLMQDDPRMFVFWGNGVAGINKSFALDEFANGQATLVALEELRAGIHPVDPRGVWALGQIGGSITWAHGVNGDAFAPNHQWPRSDDILGCAKLHETVGTERLIDEGMPCVDYIDRNQQATARSLHPDGVHVVFLDGSIRFIADSVDPGLWHAMHSRETPGEVLESFDEYVTVPDFLSEAPRPQPPVELAAEAATDTATEEAAAGTPFVNSIGMQFVMIPAGEFEMGIPDNGNFADLPECPPHRVRITSPVIFGRQEVTRQQYLDVMGSLPSADAEESDGDDQTTPEWPVTGVTWEHAAEFCVRLSERADELAASRWYRLPNEAEWEYACRSGRSEPYDWRPKRKPDDMSGEAAGILPPLPIGPVGSFPPNEFGLHDMRGNAWEWTADWFDRDYYARSPAHDPRGPAHGYLKVVRGGDWRFIGENCHIDYPIMPPWKSNPIVGFRVVCEVGSRE